MQGEEILLAACDKDLLGKKFKKGEICLSVKRSFYQGETTDGKGLNIQIMRSTIANLVGERTVNTAIDNGFGMEEDVLWVDGIPHLQIVRM